MKSSLMQKHEYYTMYRVEDNLWWYKGLRDTIQYYISKKREKLRILDAGCRTGANMKFLLSKKYLVYGIDISADAIKLCKRRKLRNVKKASILKIPFRNDFFDAISCTDVLGSMKSTRNIKIAIKEFYRVLKPNGLLLIHVAAFPFLRSGHDTVTNLSVRFLRNELLSYMSFSKWNVLKCSYRLFFLFPIVVSVKFIKNAMRRFLGAKTDLTATPQILSQLLFFIQLIENRILRFVNFPVGSSLILIAEKISKYRNDILHKKQNFQKSF